MPLGPRISYQTEMMVKGANVKPEYAIKGARN